MPLQTRVVTLGVLMSLAAAPVLRAQAPVASPADVATIPALVRAFYEVISGPPGAPRDWRRDSTLYMEGATFVAMDEKDGKPVYAILGVEEYRQKTNTSFVKNGFFETEIGSRIERFGNVAQVRSVYETRRVDGGPLTGRGINYLMAFWDGKRWWITGAVWDDERPNNPIPPSWVGSFETVP